MHDRIAICLLSAGLLAAPALAQQPSPLPLPSPVEKTLAARATHVSEVTLDKNMLGFATQAMNDRHPDHDSAQAQQVINGLDGIYVRSYEFDKPGQYNDSDIEELRKHFETSEWTPLVRESDRKSGEISDVMVKMVNGESRGMFILSAEPRELDIVLLLGDVHMNDLGALKGLSGMDALSDAMRDTRDQIKVQVKNQMEIQKSQMKSQIEMQRSQLEQQRIQLRKQREELEKQKKHLDQQMKSQDKEKSEDKAPDSAPDNN